jgi:UDP-N-acetyl-D-glucosamine dehydrogenase
VRADPQAKNPGRELSNLIAEKRALVGVLGLGYVGLPLALTFAENGYRVLGFDSDTNKPETLDRGRSYLAHIEDSRIRTARESDRLDATADLTRLSEPDAILICVPTPLSDTKEPNLRFVVESARSIRDHLRPGQLIVLESTTYPGTTEGLLKPLLEESGLRCGSDFFVAYSPEREDPGNPRFTTRTIPKLVGGADSRSTELAISLYQGVVVEVIRVSTPAVAEAAKLTENIFRSVNIALVNELKMVFDRMGIDVWEVVEAASSKPFGFMRFDPGPGWGGHCIPIDPFYLAWKAREHGVEAKFIELAGAINVFMPRYVIEKLQAALEDRGKTLFGSKILILGLAYKRDAADPRESPSFELISLLLERGAEVVYHDPHLPEAPRMRTWPGLGPLESQLLEPALLRSVDAVVVATDHSAVDYPMVHEHADLIVDTRGVYRDSSDKIVKA